MSDERHLEDIIGANWSDLLGQIDDAVIVMDEERQLRFANPAARRLLGYREGETIGGRCRKTMRGVDCEAACPLTFALQNDEQVVRNFETVYSTREGAALPLRVTVLPLNNSDGGFSGAVEVLRPLRTERSFFLVGRGDCSRKLRERLGEASARGADVILVGERVVRREVVRDVHRMSGLDDALLHEWKGSWEGIPNWPPGTVFADGDGISSLYAEELPDGWRVIAGVDRAEDVPTGDGRELEVVALPAADRLREDLPAILAAWAQGLKPGITLAAEALQRLVSLTLEGGFDDVGEKLRYAVEAADGRLEAGDIPGAEPEALLLESLLREADPICALEKRLLIEVLERSEWKMQEASDRLGMSRVTLWRKLKDHGIQRPGNGA